MVDPQQPAEPRNGAGEPGWAPGKGPDPEEPGANTEMFRAFVAGADAPDADTRPNTVGRAAGAPFRILTLLGALVAFVVIVWLLLR